MFYLLFVLYMIFRACTLAIHLVLQIINGNVDNGKQTCLRDWHGFEWMKMGLIMWMLRIYSRQCHLALCSIFVRVSENEKFLDLAM